MMTRHRIEISGMTCENCEKRVYEALSKIKNIYNIEVSYKNNSASFECDKVYDYKDEVSIALKDSGYDIKDNKLALFKMLGIIVLFVGLFMFLNMKFGNLIPKQYENLSFIVVFAIGFFTSIHCIAMCGGIVISTCSANENKKPYMPSIMYNLGRLTSYTIIGGFIGALGSVFKMSYGLQNALLLIVSVLMIITGLNMFGFKAFRKFTSFTPLKKISSKLLKVTKLLTPMSNFAQTTSSHLQSKSPYIIGLLNGFMPCGPLQAMQLYALASGSFIMGALNMFFFSLGTIPLMFGIGFASTFARGNMKGKLQYISAILVMILGATMFYQVVVGGGMLDRSNNGRFMNVNTEQVQEIVTTLNSSSYPPITVVAGKKVRWIMKATKDDINFCNNSFNSKELGIKVRLKPGDNIIEFTPTQTGVYQYQCWMNMIKSTITVVPGNGSVDGSRIIESEEENLLTPLLANRSEIAVASVRDMQVGNNKSKVQEVRTTLSDGTYKPIVVQKGVPVKWVIDVDKYDLNYCNNAFNSKELGINTKLKVGQNIIEFTANSVGLYEYNCWMNMISSNIEVVDSVDNVDITKLAIANVVQSSSDGGMSCGSSSGGG